MATIEDAASGMETKLLTMPTMLDAMIRPIIAMPMGRPIAMMDPNARTRMMTAARTPNASLSGSSIFWKTIPPYSMLIPAAETDADAFLISLPRLMKPV